MAIEPPRIPPLESSILRMGSALRHPPVLLVLAAFSRYPEALDWAAEQAAGRWGPIALASAAFDFGERAYYEPTMGPGLKKVFWAFERLIDPGALPDLKGEAGRLEADYARLARHAEPRPINLDPGYLTPAKLVLASTKDHA